MNNNKYATICLLSFCAAVSTQNVPPEIKEFSDVMLKDSVRLCRTAKICERNISEIELTRQKQQNTASCCQGCSCDETCGDRGDCCFPTSGNKVSLYDERKYQECIVPITKTLLTTEYYKYKFYYMTTVCPAGKALSHSESGEDCGSVSVAPWGSLLPIYSKSTGKIYKNRACADCHGVRDGIMWIAFMDCKEADSSQTRNIPVAENFEWLARGVLPENCQVRFRIQQPLETERCFPNIIDTCNGSQVVVPDWSEMTEEQIVSACHSGIAAPFQFLEAYANVFCFLCNGGKSREIGYCVESDVDAMGPLASFTCLLNPNTLESVRKLAVGKETRRPLACRKQDDSCVSLLCPSGQVYNEKFQCVHPALTWEVPFYHVPLRLRFEDSDRISTSTLMTLLQGNSDVSTWLKCPWPNWWGVNSLHFVIGNGSFESSDVESFIVFLNMRPLRRNHRSVLNEIKRQMTKPWTVKTPQENKTLSAEFLEYDITLMVDSNAQFQVVPLWYKIAVRNQQTQDTPFFRENSIMPIIQGKEFLQKSGRINKMNFCKQMSLGTNSSDYDVMAGNKLLSYNGTFFFDGQFELISTYDGTLEPRICIEASQYEEQAFTRSTSPQTSSFLFTVVVAVLLSRANVQGI